MSVFEELKIRSNHKCELCGNTAGLTPYVLAPKEESLESSVLICENCESALAAPDSVDENYWRCLNESMWSEHIPVQIMTYRVLNGLKDKAWALDLKGQMYFDEDALIWANALNDTANANSSLSSETKDSNGTFLNDGDSVTLIKDLVVKGANFTAKRGTLVKNISLTSNPKHVEGRVNGTLIVLVAEYLKKA